MMKKILIIIIILVLLGAGYKLLNKSDTSSSTTGVMQDVENVSTTTHMMEDGTIMEGESMEANEEMMQNAGHYEDYTPQEVAEHAKNGKVVLFFKASWCPTCRAVDKDIMDNLSNIPKDVVILKVDYDNSTELKKKYGVTYQHTFVQVDKDGNQVAKWSGSQNLSLLLDQVK